MVECFQFPEVPSNLASLLYTDSSRGMQVEGLNDRMVDVDSNLNYMLGQLSLVVQEFNQVTRKPLLHWKSDLSAHISFVPGVVSSLRDTFWRLFPNPLLDQRHPGQK